MTDYILVAHLVKNPPANAGDARDPWGRKIPLEEEMATHSSILAWKIPWKVGYSPCGCQESYMTE